MYKLILLEYFMPRMDGPAIAKEINRLVSSSLLLTPEDRPHIVCCSANGEAQVVDSALAAGMDGFMIKPLLFEDVKHLNSQIVNVD